MLSFPPRCPLPCQVGDAVYNSIVGSSAVYGSTHSNMQGIRTDCDYLQTLRSKIEQDVENADIDVLLEYVRCLQAVLLKLDLEHVHFVWTNCMGCSRAPVQGSGLHFECLNALFTIASCYMRQGALLADKMDWQGAKESFQHASGVLIRARESELHQLSHSLPLELQDSTLEFLTCVSNTQATECQFMLTRNPSEAWAAHLQYLKLAENHSATTILKDWQSVLQYKAGHSGSIACLMASYIHHNSRKKAEKALEYSALLKTKQLAVEDEVRAEAQLLIEQPRGRRLKSNLSAEIEPPEFQESNYFTSIEVVTPIPVTLSKSDHSMLEKVLPITIASAPLILSEKLKHHVEKEICDQLHDFNRYIRSTMVKCNLPYNIELLRNFGAPPGSLIRAGAQIRKRGGLQYLQDMLGVGSQKAQHCDSVIRSIESSGTDKDEQEILQNYVNAGLNAMQMIQSKLEGFAHLIEILERGDTYIANFLRSTNSSSPLSLPRTMNKHIPSAFYSKTDSFFAAIGEQINYRTKKCMELEIKAKEYNFFEPIMTLMDSSPEPREWTLNDLKDCFESALSEFDPEKNLVKSEKLKAEESVQELLQLENEVRRFRRGMAHIDEHKLKAAQSLMFAALEFYDISYNLSQAIRSYTTLNTAITNFKDKCNRTGISITGKEQNIHDMKTRPNEYTWKPGMTINFI